LIVGEHAIAVCNAEWAPFRNVLKHFGRLVCWRVTTTFYVMELLVNGGADMYVPFSFTRCGGRRCYVAGYADFAMCTRQRSVTFVWVTLYFVSPGTLTTGVEIYFVSPGTLTTGVEIYFVSPGTLTTGVEILLWLAMVCLL
jgi:hypothetical protein